MAEILPSVHFEPDNPRPVGFVDEVEGAHLQAIGEALSAVAAAAVNVTGTREPGIRVRFSSVRYMPTLPFVLYSFHILSVDDEGNLSDEVAEGEEITYAIVANHAVEVQREAAVLFLYELVFRQEILRNMRDGGSEDPIDVAIAAAVRQARQEFRDRIYAGWQHATCSIAQRAAASGLPLHVRYAVDVLPSRADVVGRMPHLRAAYNEVDIAREAIDKQVSMIGGSDPRVHAPGISQAEEDMLQRNLTSLGMRQWISQTTRDALVCGNGYLVTADTAEPSMYALRPDTVQIIDPDKYVTVHDGVAKPVYGHVMHVRGIEQCESPYGISLLEPILAEHRKQRVLQEAAEVATRILGSVSAESKQGRVAQQMLELAERSVAESNRKLDRLLWYPRDWLKDAREGLYFPGQERM